MTRRLTAGALTLLAGSLILSACGSDGDPGADGDKEPIVVGIAGARVGAIANIGEGISEGIIDWFEMVNAKGGVNGREVKILEVETEYEVPPAIEAFSRFQQDDAAVVVTQGTAITDALTPVATQNKIPLFFPGQGNLETVDGEAAPYVFPASPLYAHQASALVDYLIQENGPDTTFACLAWEAPAGREFCNGAADAAEKNFVGEVVFPARAADLAPQVNRLVDLGADVNLHSAVFGQATAAFKGLCEAAPDSIMGTWHWSVTKDAVEGAGKDCMEGMYATSMSTLTTDEPEAFTMLQDFWSESGEKPNPVALNNTVYSNGLYFATVLEEAIRLADDKVGDGPITGEDMKAALESITDFEGYGAACPITLTPKDHSGNRALNIYRVESGEFARVETCVVGPPVSGEPDVGQN